MSRVEKINSLLIKELANLINNEIFIDNCLITVTSVECSPDLYQAKIYVSVLPCNFSGTALELLNKHNKTFSNALRKKLDLKYIPKFNWLIDNRGERAEEIEKTLKQIYDEK